MQLKVEKDKVRVLVYLKDFKVRGTLYILPNSRLSDNLSFTSKKTDFLPLTDCEILFNDGNVKKVEFVLVQIASIIMIHEDK
uniref:Uncharacterized protein n=1 Tax=candidate division WOR-3 bacterium TaxID=2052148 RepID=A0A7C4Y4W4_UNCW3